MITRVQFRAAVCERPYTFLTVLALLGLGAVVLLRRPEDWELVYVPAGRLLVEGRDIYQIQITAFPYPPAAALLAAAFAQLPGMLGRVVWGLVNAAAIVAFWVCAWRSAGGVRRLRCLDPRDGGTPTLRQTDWREHAALWLGMAVGFRFVTDVLEHQQTDLLIAALTAGAALAIVRGRWLAAASLCGAATALKATPVIWVGYFLLRRQWSATAAMVTVAIGLSLLTDGISSPPLGGTWIARWVEVIVRPIGFGEQPMGLWSTAPIFNQSIPGTLFRLLTLGWRGDASALQSEAAPLVEPEAIRWVIYATQAAVLLIGLMAIGVGPRRTEGATDTRRTGIPRRAIECAVVLMLMVLLPPASSKPHFVVVLLPAYCLARLALIERDRVAGVFLLVAVTLGVVSNRSLLGDAIGYPAQWAGGITLCALTLFVGCVVALGRLSGRHV